MTEQPDDLHLYDSAHPTSFVLPQYEQNYLLPFLVSGTQAYVDNIHTRLFILKMGQQIFPVTVNETDYDNAYVCSPFTRYITYAKQELEIINYPFLKRALSFPINFLGMLLKAGKTNQVACVNNWLLSTNLYPDVRGISVEKMTQFLVTHFPQHTIMFPSLNQHTNGPLMEQLQNYGYQLIPGREVFIFDKQLKDYTNRRVTQTDFELLKKTPYQIVSHQEITEKDYERIVELYDLLYIKKYSNCNPKFSLAFIELCHSKNLLNFQGLRQSDGTLVGIIASFNRNGILATPLVGHDTQLSGKEGIYRMLTALALKEALAKELVFNMSAGVSEFKKWRGGVGFIEYNAVYTRHLPTHRRQTWNLLSFIMTKIGVPLLHRYKF